MELNNATNNNSNYIYKNKLSSIDSEQKIFQDLDNEIKISIKLLNKKTKSSN